MNKWKVEIVQEPPPMEHLPVFFTDGWLSASEPGTAIYAIKKGEEIKMLLSLTRYTRYGFQFLINPPFTPHCNWIYLGSDEDNYRKNTDLKQGLEVLVNYLISEFKNAYIDLGFPPEMRDVQVFQWNNFEIDTRYTYRLSLQKSEDALYSLLSTERKRSLKKAEQDRVVIIDADDKEVIQLVQSTLSNAGMTVSPSLPRFLENREMGLFTVAVKRDANVEAAAIIAYDKQFAYYIAGGTQKSASTSSGTLVLWKSICEARSRGVANFDFCGSTVPGIEKFFRGFGGELIPYFKIQHRPMATRILKSIKKITG